MFAWTVEIVKRNETGKFEVLRKRWIIERTFAWLVFSRRLNRDYEISPRQSETMDDSSAGQTPFVFFLDSF